jgi:hypothetical protein
MRGVLPFYQGGGFVVMDTLVGGKKVLREYRGSKVGF